MIGTNVDISDKKRSENEIWTRANFDPLTGLPNRNLFRDRLYHETEHSRRTDLQMALLFIDLDRFKEANDWLGHSAGDQLLQQAAERIRGSVRKSDTVARLGGDEFTVILPELDSTAHVEQIAQKILDELARPFQVRDEVVEVSGSIGITMFPDDADNPEDLIKHADQAMYVAKNSGRNQFSFFTRSMQEQATYRRALFGELRDAVRAKQLQLYLQPIISLHDGRIVKAEALVRWLHPSKGLLQPTEFIALAEETGLIHEIGDWVFRQGVIWAKRWCDAYDRHIQIGINKSPAQFMTHAKGIDWTSFLRQMGLSGKSISVEITEGLLLNASGSVEQELLQLRDAGVQVAIDDFGTGYSSMAYLKKFDVDYLKIDQSFVRDTDGSSGARTIAETIIVMAHKLGLEVIAEGVETEEQRDWLKDAGCDYAQGYLFSRPVPPMEFERMLNAPCPVK